MSWRSPRAGWRALWLLALFLPAACGALPRPFEGRPGNQAARLAQPPPARLAVPPPTQAMLPEASAAEYAAAVAQAMQGEALPAMAEPARPGDWRLELQAELRGGLVVPSVRVRDPAGKERGTADAAPVQAEAWAQANPETLRRAGRDMAPTVAALLAGIEAARRESDPESLLNRPPKVQLRPVVGAPGDGNRSLARQMRDQLGKLGFVVQDDAAGADYSVGAQVQVTDLPGAQQRVEIRWKVADAKGAEAGQVAQLNQVPRGTLSGLWAEVAMVVAQEAAVGVRDVIRNQTGLKR